MSNGTELQEPESHILPQTATAVQEMEDLTDDLMEIAQEQSNAAAPAVESAMAYKQGTSAERRSKRRVKISSAIRIRGGNVTENGPNEVTTTVDVSRSGVLFASTQPDRYSIGMNVYVTFPYTEGFNTIQSEQEGRVVRIVEMPDGTQAVAVSLESHTGEVVATSGKMLGEEELLTTAPSELSPSVAGLKKPVVLILEADPATRKSLKIYLESEGYDVLAFGHGTEAREAMKIYTPSLILAEIEGEDKPGYTLCKQVKATERLKHIPVILTTSSAFPSDYSHAHALGAVVCMSKPFKQERLGHIVRMLAPPPVDKYSVDAPPRTPDTSRRFAPAGSGGKKGSDETNALRRMLRFGKAS